MLYATYTLNFVLMIAMPLALGWFLARRLGVRWLLFLAGAVTFIASQIVHLPLNFALDALFDRGLLPAPPEAWQLPFNAVVLGLTAGLSEETARYVALRYWQRQARTWRQALMFGAGHGGIEAVFLGLLAAWITVQIFVLRNVDLNTLPLPPEQLPELERQLNAAWSLPWYQTLLGALERALALILHLALSVLVMQAVLQRNWLWLAAAILWHTAANAVVVYLAGTVGPVLAEGGLVLIALFSLAIIFGLRRSQTPPAQPEGSAVPAAPPAPEVSWPAPRQGDRPEELERTKWA